MRSPPRAVSSLLSVWCVAALGLSASGCHRSVKPELGLDRTVEAGVPVDFGSPREDATPVTWDFGDQSSEVTQARISHAFAKAGTYTVRAREGTREVGRVQLTAVPRPVLRAIPAEARVALWLPQLRGTVEPLLAFYEQLVGPELARRQLGDAPFLPLLVRSARGDSQRVDPEEGFGLFRLPSFEGTVALLGVTDGPAALDAVLKEFEAGGTQVRRQEDGSASVQRGLGAPITLFLDRGYLYLAIPQVETVEPGQAVRAQASVSPDAEALRGLIAGFTGPGLSEVPLLEQLRGKVAEGNAYVFTSLVEEGPGFPGALVSLRVREGLAELDGFMASEKPLMEGKQGPVPALLGNAPSGPVAAAMVSVPPELLATWIFGAPGSPRRVGVAEAWKQEGIDAEALTQAMRGDVSLLAYFDAPAFYRNFLANKRPEPRGALLLEAGLTRAEPVVAVLTKVFEQGTWNVETVKEPGMTRFRMRWMDQPLLLSVTSDRLWLQAGEPLEARPKKNVGGLLQERFGSSAFGPGHLSLMVDLGQLRADLAAPREVPGVPQVQLGAAKALGGAFLEQLTPFEHAFMDFSPEEGGARLRGRVVLRTR
ncbi:PKD domain-containing protein [Stigmatella sp. ncwal1]|uniref:PKD domain-containing protein n=1 Tax=Stigmatella ashevillensis TaxID=2995309 RepID=A0ABT5DMR0_9BACT|nr:PKD domain-containing protein [Stigmatella ashevillena]MDC0714945.1 PKD domain-containing protein [Stigmatella ashevillena]